MTADIRIPLTILLCLTPAPAWSAGFAVAEQGAESFGVAGAATARASLGECGFYNPAGWADLTGFASALGVSAIWPNITHQNYVSKDTTIAQTKANLPPYLYLAYGMGDLALAFALNVPFGSSLAWPKDWPGRFEITAISLKMFEAAPSLAYRPTNWLRLSAGVRAIKSTVSFKRNLDHPDGEYRVSLGGSALGWGGQVALLIGPWANFSLGFSYRSRVKLNYVGQANFSDVPVEFSASAHDQDISTELILPDRAALGLAWQNGPHVISLDLEYMAWRTFEIFAVNFTDPQTPDVNQNRNWHDALAIRAGYEHAGLLKDLSLLAGAALDFSPSPSDSLSPSLPDSDRFLFTAGLTYNLAPWLKLAASGGLVLMRSRKATGEEAFPGTYSGSAQIVSLGLTIIPTGLKPSFP